MDEDVDQRRDRASRLLALALLARDHEQGVLAAELEKLGSEALAHAEETEQRGPIARQRHAGHEYGLSRL